MKSAILVASLFALPCMAQQPRPLAAPDYHIPLPENIATLRPADALPKIEDAWEDAFFRCLLTEDDRARMARFLELISTTPKEQFSAGSRAFQRMDGMGLSSLRNAERDLYWEQYGRLAQVAAVKEAAAQTGKEPVRNTSFMPSPSTPARKALEGWAEVAPLDAAKWIDERNDPIATDAMMLRPLVLGWAVTDLNAATKYFVEHSKPNSREFMDTLPALRDFVLVRSFIPGLTEWFNSLPDEEKENEPNAKSTAFTSVLQRVEGAGMDEAIRFLDGVKNRKLITDNVVSRFATQWASKGKSLDVMKWTLSRPKDEKGNRAGVSAVAQVWAGKDAEGFSKWLLENREHESLDQVLLGFVKYLAGRDITEARKWIKEIKSPTLRKEAEESL